MRTLQGLLGVAADGVVGPLTLDAAARRDGAATINALCDRRLAFLRGLSSFPVFGKGWTARVATIRQAALAAVSASPVHNRRTLMDLLNGYKTYITAAVMLLAGIAQVLGLDLPALDGNASGQLILEALAVLFLRKGVKADSAKA